MNIDINDVNVGDEVTVRAVVSDVDARGLVQVGARPHDDQPGWLPIEVIISHTPKPRPIEVGELVCPHWAPGGRDSTVIAINDGVAWLQNEDGAMSVHPVSGLSRGTPQVVASDFDPPKQEAETPAFVHSQHTFKVGDLVLHDVYEEETFEVVSGPKLRTDGMMEVGLWTPVSGYNYARVDELTLYDKDEDADVDEDAYTYSKPDLVR